MAVKPILFNTDMVRAIMDGRKTQTRRVCKDGGPYSKPDMSFFDPSRRTYAIHNYQAVGYNPQEQVSLVEAPVSICPGDILWVRETWFKDAGRYMYRANYSDTEKFYMNGQEIEMKWRPSIHMPKEAARIFLKVTNVRCEKLQAISRNEAISEGVNPAMAVLNFAGIWDSTVKPADLRIYGWDANPWVWVINFEEESICQV